MPARLKSDPALMSMSKFEVKQSFLVAPLGPTLLLPLVFAFRGLWGPALVCAFIAAVYYALVWRWHRNAQADDALARAASHDATEAARPTDSDPR